MKIYMIKNKEGKYYYYEGPCNDAFVKDLFLAEIFTNLDIAKKCVRDLDKPQDYEIVEGTLAEGDLEKELIMYKTALLLSVEQLNKISPSKNNIYGVKDYDVCIFLDQARKELEGGTK